VTRRAILLEALSATPRDLARTVRRVDPAAALARPDPAGWCIMDVVAHMALAEPLYLATFQRAVAEERPEAAAIVADLSAPDLGRSLAELSEIFAARRAATIAFLSELEQRQWARWLVYAPIGPIRLREQVQALVSHDNERLGQIATLREQLR
jgi:uncharacterized damage-inducible protein DinB